VDAFSFDYCILSDMHGRELWEFGGGAKCEIVPRCKKYRPEFTKTCHFKRKKSFFSTEEATPPTQIPPQLTPLLASWICPFISLRISVTSPPMLIGIRY